MPKDFDGWNIEKKKIDFYINSLIFYEREVWWSRLGLNIGVEIDGRHEFFLRPVIVIRKFNKDMALVMPTTTQDKASKYYFRVLGADNKAYNACLSQIRVISSKRLLRKIDPIKDGDYRILLGVICQMINGLL
jgi:mRNA interferase MazF